MPARSNVLTMGLLSTPEAADYDGTKPHTLECWRTNGRYCISFVKVGRLVKYRRADRDAAGSRSPRNGPHRTRHDQILKGEERTERPERDG